MSRRATGDMEYRRHLLVDVDEVESLKPGVTVVVDENVRTVLFVPKASQRVGITPGGELRISF